MAACRVRRCCEDGHELIGLIDHLREVRIEVERSSPHCQPEPIARFSQFLQRYPRLVNKVGRALCSSRLLIVGTAPGPTALQLLDDGLASRLACKRRQKPDNGCSKVKQPLCDVIASATRGCSSFRVRIPVPSS